MHSRSSESKGTLTEPGAPIPHSLACIVRVKKILMMRRTYTSFDLYPGSTGLPSSFEILLPSSCRENR